MDDLLKNLIACLQDQEPAMRDALKRLVLIPSGTYNKAGVDRVCRAVCELLEPLPLERRILPQEKYGDMLIASTAAGGGDRRILLAGHMDTIFPEDSPFNGWREDERHFYGPGVIDMKEASSSGSSPSRPSRPWDCCGSCPSRGSSIPRRRSARPPPGPSSGPRPAALRWPLSSNAGG